MIKSFQLGSVTWNVCIDNKRLIDLNNIGMSEYYTAKISLRNEGIIADVVQETFYHELTHAILNTLERGDLSVDEQFVQGFAVLLAQFEKTKKIKD